MGKLSYKLFIKLEKAKCFQFIIHVKQNNNKQAKLNQLFFFKSIGTFSNFPSENYRAIKIFTLGIPWDKSPYLLPHHAPAQQLRSLLKVIRRTVVVNRTNHNTKINLAISERRCII